VAVIVTVPPVGGAGGASKVVTVPLAVWFAVKEPQGALAQLTDQFTPPLPGSLETVAFALSVPPAVTDVGAEGVNAMLSVLTTIENPGTVVTCPTPSVSERLKFNVVATVGVPVTLPVPALIESPSLSAGVVLQASVPNPEPWNVKLYATLTVADGTCAGVVEMTGAAGLFTVIVNGVAEVDWPNVSVTVKLNVTLCFVVGVPEITPVLELSDSPSAGRPVVLQVSAPVPVSWNVKL